MCNHGCPTFSTVSSWSCVSSEGARSEGAICGSQPAKSRNFGHHGSIFSGIWDDSGRNGSSNSALRCLADDLSRSIIQYGLHEALNACHCSPVMSCLYIYISLSHESTHSWGFPVAPFMKPRFWCFFPMNLATVSESWPYWEAFVISTSQHPCHSS